MSGESTFMFESLYENNKEKKTKKITEMFKNLFVHMSSLFVCLYEHFLMYFKCQRNKTQLELPRVLISVYEKLV